MSKVIVSGTFDDIKSRHIRFLHEASKRGDVQVRLWSDSMARAVLGKEVKFSEAERTYFLQAIRYVKNVTVLQDTAMQDALSLAEKGKKCDMGRQ